MALQRDTWEFQALVSHKLRTPLGSIVNGLALLEEEKLANLLNPEMQSIFEIVLNGANRLERDVQKILQYVYAPTLAQPGLDFDLAQLQALVVKISGEIGLKQVAVSVQPELEGFQLPLSEQSLELILREVLENAQKFHPQHEPAVEITATFLDGQPDLNRLSLQVKDDGLTLTPTQLGRVWAPYYQGDKYFTGEVAGIGLGLSKVALLIWSVGGKCYLYNRHDRSGVIAEFVTPLRVKEEID
jgi:K+-sensing histidine kinase KdpD